MANTLSGNVWKVDTTGNVNARRVVAIKYIGAASGTAVITSVDTGFRVWEESGTANVFNAELALEAPSGLTVTLTNSAVVYIYTA